MSQITKLTIISIILLLLWAFTCACLYACVREEKKHSNRPNKYKKHSEMYIKLFTKYFINAVTIQTVEQKIKRCLSIDFTLLTIRYAELEKIDFIFNYFDFSISNKRRVTFTITRTYKDIYECATVNNLVEDIILDLQDRILSLYFDRANGWDK